MKRFLSFFGACCLFAVIAQAETVLLYETFDGDYSDNFPYVYDGDGQMPASSVQAMFLSPEGYYMPWWPLKDASASTDRFISSHSCYTPAGRSDDWLGSRAIEIPSEGFNLTFGAQSYVFNEDDGQLSDLWLYITEEPLDKADLPSSPVRVWEKVPVGRTYEQIEGEFTEYSFNLDAYAGKTIYLNFANRNDDKGILCLNDIKVSRLDLAEMTLLPYEEYTLDDTYTVKVEIKGVASEGIANWKLEFNDGTEPLVESGEMLAGGEVRTLTFVRPIDIDRTKDFTVTFSGDGQEDMTCNGCVTRISFLPYRRVLLEESTGTWCGNCPLGIYNVESMLADEDMRDYVIPVSVHIPGSGATDLMVNEEYAYQLGISVAPAFCINRQNSYVALSTYDISFDKDNELTLAHRVVETHGELTLFEVAVEGEFVVEGNDTTGISCTVSVRTPLSMDTSGYRVGLILAENNVGLDDNFNWIQSNYYSGYPYESRLGGWCDLPEAVFSVRYQDVARGVWGFNGLEGSLPEQMEMDREYRFNYTIDIPDTKIVDGSGELVSPAIRPKYCEVIAYVVDTRTGEVMNAAVCPMSEVAEERFTTAQLVAVGIDEREVLQDGFDGEPEYFDLQGRRVVPTRGIYIKRMGSRVEKVILHD